MASSRLEVVTDLRRAERTAEIAKQIDAALAAAGIDVSQMRFDLPYRFCADVQVSFIVRDNA